MANDPETGITETLRDWNENPRSDPDHPLLKLVYAELHRQAHRHLQKERRGLHRELSP